VLCNSIQKSGTHLIVGLVTHVKPFRAYGRRYYLHYQNRCHVDPALRSTPKAAADGLRDCLPGEVFRGHIAHAPAVADALAERLFKHILVYRDPRDIAVSLLHWWERHDEADVWPFRRFGAGRTTDEKLQFLIEGWTSSAIPFDGPADVDYPDIGTRYAEFLPWLRDEGCLAIKFESLIGAETRSATYERIAAYLQPRATQAVRARTIAAMAEGAAPSKSRTFRKGGTGDWRKYFNETHKQSFKASAAQLLVDLGYERDQDW
jgi:hypothetical protein